MHRDNSKNQRLARPYASVAWVLTQVFPRPVVWPWVENPSGGDNPVP
jgi:hypothetical protein